jgi:hypothetical protein
MKKDKTTPLSITIITTPGFFWRKALQCLLNGLVEEDKDF